MNLNPYQPGPSVTADDKDDPLVGPVEKICLVPLVVLVVASVYHYSLIENLQVYRSSVYRGVESIAMVVACLCGVIHFARFTSFCYLGKFKRALVSLCAFVATFVLVAWAIWYDAPTLIYAT